MPGGGGHCPILQARQTRHDYRQNLRVCVQPSVSFALLQWSSLIFQLCPLCLACPEQSRAPKTNWRTDVRAAVTQRFGSSTQTPGAPCRSFDPSLCRRDFGGDLKDVLLSVWLWG